MEKAFRKNEFTLDDFLSQLNQVKAWLFENILGMIPGMGGLKKKLGDVDIDMNGKEIKHIEAIIRAMTPEEKEIQKSSMVLAVSVSLWVAEQKFRKSISS